MARGKLFSKFRPLRVYRNSGGCAVYQNAPVGRPHSGVLIQYKTVDGKVILICKDCKKSLDSIKQILRELSGEPD